MKRGNSFFYRNINKLRRTTQVNALIIIILIPVLNVLNFTRISGTYYSMSIGKLDITDPAIILQYLLINQELMGSLLVAGFLPVIIALLFGKVFCSWVCPFNLFAEYSDILSTKLGFFKKPKKNPSTNIYWLIAGSILVITMISSIPLITLLSMPGLISAQIADAVLFGTIGLELLFVVAILLIEMFIAPRFWCMYACPSGAALALFKTNKTLQVNYQSSKCKVQCSNDKKTIMCNTECPLHLNPRNGGIYPYCYNCGACVDICSNTGGQAIQFKINSGEHN